MKITLSILVSPKCLHFLNKNLKIVFRRKLCSGEAQDPPVSCLLSSSTRGFRADSRNEKGLYITSGRMLWTLARDRAVPFSKTLSRVSPTFGNPFNATLVCVVISTILNCIYIGSSTAFSAFVGSFVILSTCSYLTAILPHLITNRKHVVPGPFYMKGWKGMVVHGVAAGYIIVFVVIFCFPFTMPVTAADMNYACLVTGGLSIFVGIWWVIKTVFRVEGGYEGPKVIMV